MAFTDITLGLTLSIPATGDRNWGAQLRTDAWEKISQHQHTGSPDGLQMVTNSYSADSVTGAKIRLDNDEFLRGRNQANSADINILKVDTSDQINISPASQMYQGQAADIVVPSATGTQAINCNNGNFQKLDLTSADVALDANLTNIKAGTWYSVLVLHGATDVVITWQAEGVTGDVLWPNGDAAVLSGDLGSANGKTDQVWFYSDGSKLYGRWEVDFQ